MEFSEIRFEVTDGIALIRLHRPDKLNAFTGAMGRELGQVYRVCDEDDAIRAVVLTGSGRAFCAGADMSAGAATFEKRDDAGFSAAAFDPPAFRVRKPVIAAVNGHAIGIGLTIALQCDLRFLALEGKYAVVQVRRGVMPDAYAHWTLPRIVGLERAADLLLSGRTVTGSEALDLGLASRALPAEAVLDAALAWAREVAVAAAPLSVALTKRLLWESSLLDADEVGRRETELHHHLMAREDAIEGGRAYAERRTPHWKLGVKADWPGE